MGIYVQECLQFLGVATDHIAVRTSYRGREDYLKRLEDGGNIQVHGLQYLLENLNHEDSLLIVDDVFSTGQNINALLKRLAAKTKRNLPANIRVAVPYYKPSQNKSERKPDYYLHQTTSWLVLPYELSGLSDEEILTRKKWISPPTFLR